MSWEIQGQVESAADVDALAGQPTEAPTDDERAQVAAVVSAVKALVDASVVEGPLYVRAGGHANEGATVDGQPREMVTLTIDCQPPAPEAEVEQVEKPTWGDALTNTPEQVAAAEGRTVEPDPDAETATAVADDAGE